MNYAFNLRDNAQLFQSKQPIPQHQTTTYFLKNQISLGNYIRIQQQPLINQALKGPYLDAFSLVEGVTYYSQIKEQITYNQTPSLNLHNGLIYMGEEGKVVDLSWLYILLLEKTFQLSNGFKALMDDQNASAKKIFRFFSRIDIQEEIKQTLYLTLIKHKANHRDKSQTALLTEKEVSKKLIDKLSFGFTCGILNDEDFSFWMQFSASHDNWKKAYESTAMFEKLFPAKHCQQYKPWLIVIRSKMLQIEKDHQLILNNLQQNGRLASLILCVIAWLCEGKHRNLLAWLLHFLFSEECTDTKKPYLFLHGPPNSGKTFFMGMLTPHNTEFLLKSRTFAHFGAEKAGDYELHLLLFDDPGDAKGKGHQLDPSAILNLSNKNYTHSLPVKFGFMNLKRGQIAIISNRDAALMFPEDSIEAVKTRLLEVEFANERPFPLKGESHLANPFIFDEEIQIQDYSQINAEEIEEEDEDEEEDEEEMGDAGFVVQETFHVDLLFYILWRAIFRVLKIQLSTQHLSTLKYYVPNKSLRSLIRKPAINCIYEILCQKLTEQDLHNMLSKKS